jgi:aspartyl-tRNA(Asn)/glutamyl-tRNA(Gln) amidotransferase subunit B
MEQGSMRCDVNVSLMPRGAQEWGTRTETKNVNSLRSVERAVRSEIERQAGVLDAGGRVVQETRHFHEDTGRTTSGRSKEEAQDYRYFPEPDLVPMAPSREWVEEVRASLPELPAARRRRIQAEWNLSDLELRDVVNAGAVDLIEATVAQGTDAPAARKWWMNELSRRATEQGVELADLPITPEQVARVQAMISAGELNDKLARKVFEGVLAGEGTPDEVVAKRGLKVVSDEGELSSVIDRVIADNADVADKIRAGKVAPAGLDVGAVMNGIRAERDAPGGDDVIEERLGGG